MEEPFPHQRILDILENVKVTVNSDTITVMLDVTTLAFRLINAVVSGNHGVIFIGFPAKGKDTDPAIKIPQ